MNRGWALLSLFIPLIVGQRISPDTTRESSLIMNATVVSEVGVRFSDGGDTEFELREFKGGICRQMCEEDPLCLYAFRPIFDPQNCLVARNGIEPANVQLVNNNEAAGTDAFWKNDPEVRGDFCERCNCDPSAGFIDCRGQDLLILPATFSGAFVPRVLDLRDNPHLVFIGKGSFESWTDSLEELWLPTSLVYIEESNLLDRPRLTRIEFEEAAEDTVDERGNYIVDSTELFKEVCCSPATNLETGRDSLAFCEVDFPFVGDDTFYEPFIYYAGTELIATYTASSPFFADTVESPERCAEACSITRGCLYFRFEALTKDASCTLMEEGGLDGVGNRTANLVGQYRDEAKTLPAAVSGWSPTQRFLGGDARVFVAESQLLAQESNGYSVTLEFYLKVNPLRGGVWVTPFLVSASGAKIEFQPRAVALYDNMTSASIQVTVSNPLTETLLLTANIEACDEAFMGGSTDEGDLDLVLNVETPVDDDPNTAIIVGAVIGALLLALGGSIFLYLKWKKHQNDSLWMVKMSQLHFHDPLFVLGRGGFGLVLQADYRGTRVAVKKIHPADNGSLALRSGTTSATGSSASSLFPGSVPSADYQYSYFGSGVGRDRNHSMASMGLSGWIKNARANQRKTKKIKNDFIREMRQLAKLRHPCVTTIMGAVVEDNAEPMLVMEYMEHGSLHGLLHNDSVVLDGQSILPIFLDIAQGVRFLHSADPEIIHGDLKAANILIDSNFRAKVSDFGLSSPRKSGATGTPYWMAPELLRGTSRNNQSTDVYSFGVIIYEVYSRKDPYDGEKSTTVLRLIADSNEEKRLPVPPSCPPAMTSLMTECLSEDPFARPLFDEIDEGLKAKSAADLAPLDEEEVDALITTRSAEHLRKLKNGDRSDELLVQLFPKDIADGVRENRSMQPHGIACATVIFFEIPELPVLKESLNADQLTSLLDRLDSKLHDLCKVHKVFPIETNNGSIFVGVTNVDESSPDHHARVAANFCVAAMASRTEILLDPEDPSRGHIHLLCGVHSGPVTASVVGSKCPRLCLFGDSLMISRKLANTSLEGRVHCSTMSASLLVEQEAVGIQMTRRRTNVLLPGHSEIETFWVGARDVGSEDEEEDSEEIE